LQPFLEAAIAGRPTTSSEWERYLVAFHNEHPDANELFTFLRTGAKLTSYQVLARTIQGPGKNILDLGCGDGNFVDGFANAADDIRITGVDVAQSELAIARRRHADDHRVRFDQEDARNLPYAEAAFDIVVAHQFLNFMSEPVQVLHEAARVLRHDGRLLIVANRGWTKDRDVNWIFLDNAARAVVKELYPQFAWPAMGDRRIYSEPGILDIFAECPDYDVETLTIAEFVPGAFMTPEQVAAMYNRLYIYGSLPDRAPILRAVENRARELSDVRNVVEVELPFRLVNVVRKK
jgi:ubiquinone/menaquinone biosynthesis C-methylase UbiE